MPTVTARLITGAAAPLTAEPFTIFVELSAGPDTTRQLLSGTTDGSGNLSLTLDQGTYQLRIPRTRDVLRFKVPSGSASLSISNLLC